MTNVPDWQAIRVGLLQWFRDRLGTDDLDNPIPADWDDEQPSPAPNGIRGILFVLSVAERGRDWVRYEVDENLDPGADYVPVQYGQRRVTITFAVESDYQQPGSSPYRFLERVRTALRSPSSRTSFRDLGLGLVFAEPTERVTGPDDGDGVARSTMDVHFHVAVRFVDELGATSWIENIEGTIEMEGPDGTDAGGTPTEFQTDIGA